MSGAYATSVHALGICDRCGFQYKLDDLKIEVINYNETDIKVCPTCWDGDQPQLHVNGLEVDDPQALRGPRPDQGLEASRELNLTAWNEKYGGG